jgi:thymidylate synthase ThyX
MQIYLHTENNPEDNAMLQALYSRSPKSVNDHLAKLAKVGSGKFMEQFYLGYGHASIADCGFVTLYFEGVSMLAAKAIEDSPLFNGQECSSRYIDFSQQPFINPFTAGSAEYQAADLALSELRLFYINNLEPVRESLRQRFPNENATQDMAVDLAYEKAIQAKAFDILRGYLPAGAATNVAWTTSLRKAHERLVLMMHHPLKEVQELACKAYGLLKEQYPHSFKSTYALAAAPGLSDLKDLLNNIEEDGVTNYLSEIESFYSDERRFCEKVLQIVDCYKGTIYVDWPGDSPINLSHALPHRPPKQALPRHNSYARIPLEISLLLDFGSFRDIQRHRGGYCSNPVLDMKNGFHPWYYDQLPEESRQKVQGLFKTLSDAYGVIKNPLDRQYVSPMGTIVPVNLEYTVAQAVYVAELRTGKTVHPTLRKPMQELAKILAYHGVQVYADMDESDWTLRRGTQDIVAK